MKKNNLIITMTFIVFCQMGCAQNFNKLQVENIGREFIDSIQNKTIYDYCDYQSFPIIDSVNCLAIYGENFKNTLDIQNISKHKNLKLLKLEGRFNNFPEPIFKLSQVQEFILNNVSELNWDLFFTKCAKIPNLKSIIIYNCVLNEVPNSIELLLNIEHLELNSLNIDYIPESISNLKKIKFLRITNTKISNIPERFHNNELIYLDISENSFNGIPYELINFSELQYLRFIGNNYYSSNDSILCKMKKLKSINLSGSGLEKFPARLNCLLDLKELIIDDNMFDEIPDDIFDFANIQFISIDSYPDKKRISYLRKKMPHCTIISRPNIKINPIIEELK